MKRFPIGRMLRENLPFRFVLLWLSVIAAVAAAALWYWGVFKAGFAVL